MSQYSSSEGGRPEYKVEFCRLEDILEGKWRGAPPSPGPADGGLAKWLGLEGRSWLRDTESDGFPQLRYIEQYLKGDRLKCKTVAVESHYIDRHHIEDHSEFYSRAFTPYPNFCRRLHFFRLTEDELVKKISGLIDSVRGKPKTGALLEKLREGAAALSREAYLGFCVIRPIKGAPVGRTVLQCYGETPLDGRTHSRHFTSTLDYKVHFMGVEWTVRGLAFQQQDTAVSACATTAIWCSLHYLRGSENIPTASSAQITRLATKYRVPTGRGIPSDGLTIDQMCQALKDLGLGMSLIDLKKWLAAKAIIHSALLSGTAPIGIIRCFKDRDLVHAITLCGMALEDSPGRVHLPGLVSSSHKMCRLYVHDDRRGPYLPARLGDRDGMLKIEIGRSGHAEDWQMTHLVIPTYPKIRLSFVELNEIACVLAAQFLAHAKTVFAGAGEQVEYSAAFMRGSTYHEDLICGTDSLTIGQISKLSRSMSFPRYIAVIKLSSNHCGRVDLIVDTTDRPRNTACLALISRAGNSPQPVRSRNSRVCSNWRSMQLQGAYVLPASA